MAKLTALSPDPMVLTPIELRPAAGEASRGFIVESRGRAGETLILAFNVGPLAGRIVMLDGLARDNRDLSKPVDIDMIGTIERVAS